MHKHPILNRLFALVLFGLAFPFSATAVMIPDAGPGLEYHCELASQAPSDIDEHLHGLRSLAKSKKNKKHHQNKKHSPPSNPQPPPPQANLPEPSTPSSLEGWALNQTEYRYLDDLALKAGADKGSCYHNYTEVYARYFPCLRDKPIKFLEIGIFEGASVKLWEEYFKNADLHFIDITFQNIKHFSNRSHYHLCDQENPESLQAFIQKTGGDFDLIIDDGGHTMKQQITSFVTLFPYLKSGGIYIIEDLHTSYWSWFPGSEFESNTIAFLKALIDDVNFVGAKSGKASHLSVDPLTAGELTTYREKILSMHFYDSIAIIIKR